MLDESTSYSKVFKVGMFVGAIFALIEILFIGTTSKVLYASSAFSILLIDTLFFASIFTVTLWFHKYRNSDPRETKIDGIRKARKTSEWKFTYVTDEDKKEDM